MGFGAEAWAGDGGGDGGLAKDVVHVGVPHDALRQERRRRGGLNPLGHSVSIEKKTNARNKEMKKEYVSWVIVAPCVPFCSTMLAQAVGNVFTYGTFGLAQVSSIGCGFFARF